MKIEFDCNRRIRRLLLLLILLYFNSDGSKKKTPRYKGFNFCIFLIPSEFPDLIVSMKHKVVCLCTLKIVGNMYFGARIIADLDSDDDDEDYEYDQTDNKVIGEERIYKEFLGTVQELLKHTFIRRRFRKRLQPNEERQGGPYYEFWKNTISVTSTILHFQYLDRGLAFVAGQLMMIMQPQAPLKSMTVPEHIARNPCNIHSCTLDYV